MDQPAVVTERVAASGPAVATGRAGRRPGTSTTRPDILAAAGGLFAEHGYDRTSIRAIAAAAGVNPALVHHYFGTKEQVFAAVMQFPVDPAEIARQVLDGDRDRIGERAVRFFLQVWDDPARRDALMALLRSATSNEQAAAMMREFIGRALLGRLVRGLEVPPLRVTAAAAQLVGLVMVRHVLRVEPLASAPIEELAELVGPTIQGYLVP